MGGLECNGRRAMSKMISRAKVATRVAKSCRRECSRSVERASARAPISGERGEGRRDERQRGLITTAHQLLIEMLDLPEELRKLHVLSAAAAAREICQHGFRTTPSTQAAGAPGGELF